MSDYIFHLTPQIVQRVETEFRKIQTRIPAPGTQAVLDVLSKFESRSMHGQLPIIWDEAKDSHVIDCGGNKFIDFTSTIFVANVGHGNERVAEYVKRVLDKPLVATYAYPNKIRAEYIARLIQFAGPAFEKAFLMSAGTEATDAALKLMRMHGQENDKRRNIIISITGNWHGRTMGAQSMSSNEIQKKWLGDAGSFIKHLDFPYPRALNGLGASEFLKRSIAKLEGEGIDIAQDISGVMLETFQGWGAVFYPKEYVQELRTLCDTHGILLAFDEMQAGFGRTGKKFGYEHYEVTPDLICCGKGMGGGFPLSAVLGKATVMDLPSVGNMSSTHSGSPILCAAGLAVLDEIEERNLVRESQRKGLILHQGLENIRAEFPELISQINGIGLIAAIIFNLDSYRGYSAELVSMVAEKCMQKGLLVVHTGRESIKIGPPLIISESEILEGLSVLRESIAEIFSNSIVRSE